MIAIPNPANALRLLLKSVLALTAVLICSLASGQRYEDQMNLAGQALGQKDYCGALAIFQTAFADTSKIGTYEYAFAAVAAANCKEEALALSWLSKSQKRGLGLNPGEAEQIAGDSAFVKLHAYPAWNSFVRDMRQAALQKQQEQERQAAEWATTITSNQLSPKQKKGYNTPKPGIALYSIKVGSLDVPYLVYIPKTYKAARPMQAIVYLHGGVVSTENFATSDPGLAQGEPIFAVGDTFNAIIIYPFAKKDFGWVNQVEAFENVFTVIQQVQQRYNIDKKRVYIGGMSNGGSATFWFANQRPNIFKGFYTFSALPKLEIADINFHNLAQGKTFYSLHAKDDDLYRYEEVSSLYQQNKSKARDWRFESVDSGGHGFIYNPSTGRATMNGLFARLLATK